MANDEDEDDYLSMSFAEPSSSKESSLQRNARLKREAAERGRIPSKAELAAKAEAARDVALATKLDASNNKGAKLMAKMGFKGGALGAVDNQGRENPIQITMKDDRGGIGMDSEKKRKLGELGEAQEAAQRKAKTTADDYTERNRQEAEDKRAEGQWWASMKVLEGLEEFAQDGDNAKHANVALRSINILYRPLVKGRRANEQKKRDMKLLYQDRSQISSCGHPEFDADDKLAIVDQNDDLTEDDTELDEYEALPPLEKLAKVVDHLRQVYEYCFWCKYQYEDDAMDGCPGAGEDEHG